MIKKKLSLTDSIDNKNIRKNPFRNFDKFHSHDKGTFKIL